MIQKIKTFILSHKIIFSIIILVIAVGVYFIIKNNKSVETSYVTENVKIGSITKTITGTGQVEASSTIDLKPKVTGDVTYIGVKAGEVVKKGKLIVSVDSRDAKVALENAKISLEKLTKDPDTLTLLQQNNSLVESYNSGWNKTSSFVTDMTLMISDLEDLYGNDGYFSYNNISNLKSTSKTKITLAEENFYIAKESIKDLTKLYKSLSRSSSNEEIINLINKSYESAKIVANTIKDTESAFNYLVSYLDDENSSEVVSTRSDITSWITSSNSYVNDLSSSLNNIKENTQSLEDTIVGSDELDIRQAQLTLQSKQDAYNDCFLYAPFDGVIATLSAQIGQSSGTSVGTLITKEKIVTIPFNEVDISSVKLDQKAVLLFDAIDGLSVGGVVSEIDQIGTVSSGVVTYNVKVSLDSKDERIKPGMSVSVEIITDQKENILTVPSGSVKTKNGNTYVEILNKDNIVVKQKVEAGISDDTLTEIISGLKENENVITKTVTGTSSSTTSTTPNILSSISGGRGMAGGTPPKD